MKGSSWRWLVVVPVAFAVPAVLALLSWKPGPVLVAFPENSEVLSVTGSLSGEGFTHETVPEFQIPAQYVPRLLAAFRPARQHNYPAFWDVPPIAELKITLRDGRTAAVTFGFSGKNALCYDYEGHRCVRGGERKPVFGDPAGGEDVYIAECMAVVSVIREIHHELVTGEESQSLVKLFADLERSAGLRHPEIRKL